jgi:hypothetical protein
MAVALEKPAGLSSAHTHGCIKIDDFVFGLRNVLISTKRFLF